MDVFFSITLGISIVGLVLLLSLKRYELRTGRRLFGGMRPLLDRFFRRVLLLIEHALPRAVESGGKQAGHASRYFIRHAFAGTMGFFERMLEVMLHTVREKTEPQRGSKNASEFLQEVAEHKRQLDKQPEEKRVIFED